MTVLAWDGKTLAADRRACNSGLIRTMTKIRRIGDLRVGCAGDAASAAAAFAWIEAGAKPEQFPDCQKDKDAWCSILVIDADSNVLLYETTPHPIRFEDKIFATGSGRDFALAAMYCGKTAAEAVMVASHFEAGCGNGVDVLE